MGKFKLALGAAGLLAGLSTGAYADAIPYPDVGTPITVASYDFTATATGDLAAYFYGYSAGDLDYLQISINGGTVQQFFPNKSTPVGSEVSFAVTAGDSIDFSLWNASTSTTLEDTTANADGYNHAYVTPFSGGIVDGAPIPAGTFVGFEDLLGAPYQGSDFDYNDDQFVFTNVSSGVPEPSTWAMMGLGFAALGFAGFRARKTSVSIA